MARLLKGPEEQQHIQAFEVYYGLGPSRTLLATAKNLGIGENTVKGWSRTFKWADRVIERDKAVAVEMDKRGTQLAVTRKLEYLDIVHKGMEKFREGLESGRIKVKSVSDAERLINMYVKLVGEQQVPHNTLVLVTAKDIIMAERQARAGGTTIDIDAGEFTIQSGEGDTINTDDSGLDRCQ